MSILTTEQYQADADCPELVDNPNFAEDDEDYEEFDSYYHSWDDFEDDWETHA